VGVLARLKGIGIGDGLFINAVWDVLNGIRVMRLLGT